MFKNNTVEQKMRWNFQKSVFFFPFIFESKKPMSLIIVQFKDRIVLESHFKLKVTCIIVLE